MKSPILGGSYVARSTNAADNRMVNLYPEAVPEGGKEPAFLTRCPGLTLYYTGAAGVYIRGVYSMNVGSTGKHLFYVIGQQLWWVNLVGVHTFIGNVGGGNTSPNVMFADNGTQLFILTGGTDAYIWNTASSVFQKINTADPDFTIANSVTYLDGYFVTAEGTNQKIYVSGLLDGLSWDALAYTNVDASPDNVVALIAISGDLWVLGESSTEVWYNAGTTPFPFAPIQGSFNEVGCVSKLSVTKLDNSVFWLGCDARGTGIVYRSNGYLAQRISTHAIEWQIQQYSTISDAVAWTYQQEGHLFYVLNFPTADATWVYDVSTQMWHERASWDGNAFHRHVANCCTFLDGQHIVGDNDGKLYVLDLDAYDDNGAEQKWLRSWRAIPTGQNNLKRTAHHSLQLDCETGAPDQEATIVLRWSDDGGHTWSNEHSVTTGDLGNYSKRVIWRRLGMTMKLRDRVYEISSTYPQKVAIMGAEIHMSPTNA